MNVSKQTDFESSKPYNGFPKLAVGYHKICCVRESSGMYGRSVIAELEKEIVFLPSYLTTKLFEKEIAELNSMNEPNFLYFGGKKSNKDNTKS